MIQYEINKIIEDAEFNNTPKDEVIRYLSKRNELLEKNLFTLKRILSNCRFDLESTVDDVFGEIEKKLNEIHC